MLAATYCAEDGYANPLKVGPAYLSAALRMGLVLECFTEVTAIPREGGIYRVEASGKTWQAPVVVNATGAWLDRVAALAGIGLRMAPCSLQMHATVRLPPMPPASDPAYWRGSVRETGDGRQRSYRWRLAARTLDLATRTQASIPSLLGNVSLAQRILPFLQRGADPRVWGGPFAPTPDELPVIGEVPGYPGFLVVGGSYAFTLAPLWGKVLCALALGRLPGVDLQGLGPERLLRAADAERQPHRSWNSTCKKEKRSMRRDDVNWRGYWPAAQLPSPRPE